MTRCLAVALVFGAAACTDPTGGSIDGKAVFASMCASCHGPHGKPSESMAAQLAVRDLTDPKWRVTATAALVEHQVRTGSTNKLMPSFTGALSATQITAVAAYVASPAFVTPGTR